MKKLVLLFTGLLMGLTTVTAAEKIDKATQGEDVITTRYRFAQPIQFVERGVEFLVFPDGSFDFNTNFEGGPYYDDYGYYKTRNSRRASVNTTFGAPGTQVRFSTPRRRGVLITHDYNGRVRRIGNVFVNYNRYDQVRRLGSVYINYDRKGLVRQIGGLYLKYNKHGRLIKLSGQVNYSNSGCGICGITGCEADHFGTHNHGNGHYDDNYDDWNNGWEEDDDYYYYKSGKKSKKVKKLNKKRH